MTFRTWKCLVALLVILPLVAVVTAVFLLWNRYVFASDIVLIFFLYALNIIGIGIGYHRMLTHNGFESSRFLRGLFIILGCAAFEGAPVDWAATHIKHHAHSDEEDDPHSPIDGFWHAHVGWIFGDYTDKEKWAPHLLKDPVVMFVQRTAGLWMGLSLLIPFMIGGWTGLIWGGGVRIFLVTHVTWSVNSICHTFGRRDFEVGDESRNHWFVGLLAFGEGWHNNHHAFPRSAFHGLRWWQFDLSGLLIRFMESVGLIWNVQRISATVIDHKKEQSHSMQEKLSDLREQLSVAIQKTKEDLVASTHYSENSALKAARKRLDEIHLSFSRATHLKKRKLQQYLDEVADLSQRAQQGISTFAS